MVDKAGEQHRLRQAKVKVTHLETRRCAANIMLEQKLVAMEVLFPLGDPVGDECALAAAVVAHKYQGKLTVTLECVRMRVKSRKEVFTCRYVNILCYTARRKSLMFIVLLG